jgi:23S rRNA-/tRNA-specific pseudouridylate synthase
VPGREFPILYEDDCLLAIDKPAGVAVHGGSGVSFGVIEQLRMARPQAGFWNWCTGWTAKPAASCWWPRSAAR